MKNIAIIALMLVSAGVLYAQKTEVISQPQYEVFYEYNVKVNEATTETYQTLLQIGSSCTKFTDYATYQLDSVSQIAKVPSDTIEKYQHQENMVEHFFEPQIYQNYPSGKLTYHDIIVPNFYGYEEKMPHMTWEIAEDTATVCGYVCQKAVTEYGGRKWTAWFAMEIPVSYGPWKFAGLPGLVLDAVNEEGNLHFTATVIRRGSVPLTITSNTQRLSISRDRFVQNKNRFELAENQMSLIPVESISSFAISKGGAGGKGIISINGVPWRRFKTGGSSGIRIVRTGDSASASADSDEEEENTYVPLELK